MKKVVSVLLITGLISPVMCNVAEASGNSRVINSSHFENVISPSSLTGLPAPMPGAKLIGKKYGSRSGNISTAADIATVLAYICGTKIDKEISTIANILMKSMHYTGIGDVYYIRYSYQSADGWYFYYRYDYYTDSTYTKKAGSKYSDVFGRYAWYKKIRKN